MCIYTLCKLFSKRKAFGNSNLHQPVLHICFFFFLIPSSPILSFFLLSTVLQCQSLYKGEMFGANLKQKKKSEIHKNNMKLLQVGFTIWLSSEIFLLQNIKSEQDKAMLLFSNQIYFLLFLASF